MSDEATQNTLRATLEANVAASENGTLGQVVEAAPIETEEQKQDRLRDEQGRFAAKEQPENTVIPPTAEPEPVAVQQEIPRPTTWKKEFLPIYDKLATGAPLTPEESRKLAQYSAQREKEYATGVSTYKAEAQHAVELQKAMEPFIPTLQQHNMKPAQWINEVGRAHQILAGGTPEQKMQMFASMAKSYGIPLEALSAQQSGQLDPIVPQLMQYIQNLEGKVNTVTSWREQQENHAIKQELSKFTDAGKYPYFEQVRGTMAQLLESGLAPDLDKAYTKAVRMTDEVFQLEQERQAQLQIEKQQQASKAATVVKAKAAAVSTRSSTPSGTAINSTAKDRRSMLAESLEAATGGRV